MKKQLYCTIPIVYCWHCNLSTLLSVKSMCLFRALCVFVYVERDECLILTMALKNMPCLFIYTHLNVTHTLWLWPFHLSSIPFYFPISKGGYIFSPSYYTNVIFLYRKKLKWSPNIPLPSSFTRMNVTCVTHLIYIFIYNL
jgi:hypothetical protein